MTLDEAIEHAKEVARTCDDSQRAAEHIQLAEWLRQARGADKAARWYTANIRGLEAENAKLRELVSLYHYGATHEASPSDTLAWSCKVDSLRRELGMEVD